MSRQVKDFPVAPITANFTSEQARLGKTNTEMARALSVSERQITRWRGGQLPDWRFVVAMARYFGRSPEWFYARHPGISYERDAA